PRHRRLSLPGLGLFKCFPHLGSHRVGRLPPGVDHASRNLVKASTETGATEQGQEATSRKRLKRRLTTTRALAVESLSSAPHRRFWHYVHLSLCLAAISFLLCEGA